jgi:hypothetical protein
MKKILLLIPFVAASLYASAQCTPDTSIHQVGMYPDSFPHGTENVAYSQVFQFKFPSDTMTPFGQIAIDSVQVTKVQNLPAGFTYQCSKPNCMYPGGANGCVVVAGTPDSAATYHVGIILTAWGTVAGQPIPAQDTVFIDFTVDQGTSGLSSHAQLPWNFDVMQNYPNPFSTATEISFTMPQAQKVTFKVYDLLGKTVTTRTVNAVKGQNKITLDRNGMNAGMYFYSIQYGDHVVTKRMSVKN